MILSENSSTLGSRCCSAARSETEWQRNESWKVRLLKLPPKLNMQARASTAASGRAAGWWVACTRARHLGRRGERTDRHLILGPTHGLAYRCLRRLVRSFYAFHGLPA